MSKARKNARQCQLHDRRPINMDDIQLSADHETATDQIRSILRSTHKPTRLRPHLGPSMSQRTSMLRKITAPLRWITRRLREGGKRHT